MEYSLTFRATISVPIGTKEVVAAVKERAVGEYEGRVYGEGYIVSLTSITVDRYGTVGSHVTTCPIVYTATIDARLYVPCDGEIFLCCTRVTMNQIGIKLAAGDYSIIVPSDALQEDYLTAFANKTYFNVSVRRPTMINGYRTVMMIGALVGEAEILRSLVWAKVASARSPADTWTDIAADSESYIDLCPPRDGLLSLIRAAKGWPAVSLKGTKRSLIAATDLRKTHSKAKIVPLSGCLAAAVTLDKGDNLVVEVGLITDVPSLRIVDAVVGLFTECHLMNGVYDRLNTDGLLICSGYRGTEAQKKAIGKGHLPRLADICRYSTVKPIVKYNRAVMVDARNYYGLLKAASDGTLAATEDGQAIIKATK